MEALFDQLSALVASGGEDTRLELLKRLDKLQMQHQTPSENHIKFRVQYIAQFTCIRIGIDLGIFQALSTSNGPLSTSALADLSGAAPDLLRRILRHLASVYVIDETAKDEFAANSTTRVYAEPVWKGAIGTVLDVPLLRALPAYLAETRYQSPTSTASPAQKVLGTTETLFGWLTKESKTAERMTDTPSISVPASDNWLDKFHHVQRITVQGSGSWLDVFPIDQELENWNPHPDQVLFVDLGGGMFNGQQCGNFRKKFPDLKGRVVLQDLPDTLKRVEPINGTELMAQDFFEPQSIHGAKFYYLREVLHDWSKDKCVDILNNLATALDKGSRILIDEMVLPDVGCSWQAAGADVGIMTIGGAERTRGDWEQIVQNAAGLKISEVYLYCTRSYRSVIVVRTE